MKILTGDNLSILMQLTAAGEKFDLIELDGPYMANLESWDDLTPEQYRQHYADRLTWVRQLLQPWGACFIFGYPEGCADIVAWAQSTKTLYLRRWIHWVKHQTAHAGRKVEVILFLLRGKPSEDAAREFGQMLKTHREQRGWTLAQVQQNAEAMGYPRPWWKRGGNLYFETGSGGQPSAEDLLVLSKIFGFDPDKWAHVVQGSYEGLTDIDIIKVQDEQAVRLNDEGLRSKPVQLYLQLFKPVLPAGGHKPRALILYGGSGNAGIAAEALGYDVTLCELDPKRVKAIEHRATREVPRWSSRVRHYQQSLPNVQASQLAMFGD